jgi:hypothetical protein
MYLSEWLIYFDCISFPPTPRSYKSLLSCTIVIPYYYRRIISYSVPFLVYINTARFPLVVNRKSRLLPFTNSNLDSSTLSFVSGDLVLVFLTGYKPGILCFLDSSYFSSLFAWISCLWLSLPF